MTSNGPTGAAATDKDRLVEKIQNLFDLAGNEGATEAEASLAAEKAQELMLKYGIEAAEVAQRTETKLSAEEHVEEAKLDPWRRVLAGAVATGLGGDCVYTRVRGTRRGTVYFIAQGGQAGAMAELFKRLCDQLELIYNAEYDREPIVTDILTGERLSGHTRRASWFMGATERIRARLQQRKRAIERTENAQALVLMRDVVKERMREQHPFVETENPFAGGIGDYGQFARGAEAGEKLDLGDRKITHTPKELRK